MDVQKISTRFDQAASALCPKLRDALSKVPDSAKRSAQEIRLRVGAPIAVTIAGQTWFLGERGELHNRPQQECIVQGGDLSDSIITMCQHSVHSHQHEMKNGYISLPGGHRAGLCGRAVLQNDEITALRDITSINLRVAREIHGAATELVGRIFAEGLCGVLIAGPPSSGKTTILRDLARQLSGGKAGRFYRIAVVDERCELGAVYEGIPQNNLGPGCDILSGYPKGAGILTAVRTLSPQVVICDEIGSGEEVDSILDGLNCGVKVIASAHAGGINEILKRTQIIRLMEHGAFEQIVLLENGETPGKIREIINVESVINEGYRYDPHNTVQFSDGDLHVVGIAGEGF